MKMSKEVQSKTSKILDDLTNLRIEDVQNKSVAFCLLFLPIYLLTNSLPISFIATFILFSIAYLIKIK